MIFFACYVFVILNILSILHPLPFVYVWCVVCKCVCVLARTCGARAVRVRCVCGARILRVRCAHPSRAVRVR